VPNRPRSEQEKLLQLLLLRTSRPFFSSLWGATLTPSRPCHRPLRVPVPSGPFASPCLRPLRVRVPSTPSRWRPRRPVRRLQLPPLGSPHPPLGSLARPLPPAGSQATRARADTASRGSRAPPCWWNSCAPSVRSLSRHATTRSSSVWQRSWNQWPSSSSVPRRRRIRRRRRRRRAPPPRARARGDRPRPAQALLRPRPPRPRLRPR
jgi:hypothetical protein